MVCTWQEAWTRYLPQDPGAGVAAGVAGNDGVPSAGRSFGLEQVHPHCSQSSPL
jgi:hypothetical protein